MRVLDTQWESGKLIKRVAHSTARVTQGRTYETRLKTVERSQWCKSRFKVVITDDNGNDLQPSYNNNYWNKIEEVKMSSYRFKSDTTNNFTNGKLYTFDGCHTHADSGERVYVTMLPDIWEELTPEESEAAAQPLGEWAGACAVISNVREFIAQAEEKIKVLGRQYEEENAEAKIRLDVKVDKLNAEFNVKHNTRERALEVRRNTIHEERQELADWVCDIEKQMGEKE